jgi:LacI family transcriptional regulator
MSSPSPKYVSMRQIAEALGVHPDTVSKALAKHPRIPLATRERVQAKAEELGYRPDPVLRSFQAYTKHSLQPRALATIALVVMHDDIEEWEGNYLGQQYLQGIRRRAGELGYLVEPFYLSRLRKEGKKLDQILQARGIRAVLLAAAPGGTDCDELSWQHYAAATLGYAVTKPAIHRAVHHFRFAMKTALERLRQRGYRRFALAYSPVDEQRLQDGWTSGFRVEQGREIPGEEFFFYRQKFPSSDR